MNGVATHKASLLQRAGERLFYPHSIDDYLALFSKKKSTHRVFATIVDTHLETADCTSITLKPNKNWKGYKAGQYVLLTAEIDGRRYARCYTISDANHKQGTITLTVKLQDKGLVSNWVNHYARTGMTVEISQAQGEFVLPKGRQPLIMIAGGCGITAFKALLKQIEQNSPKRDVTLLYFSRDQKHTIFADELSVLEKSLPNLDVRMVYTLTKKDEKKYFEAALLDDLAFDVDEADIMVCGPVGLIQSVEEYCKQNNLLDQFYKEAFALPIGKSTNTTVNFVQSNKQVTKGEGSILDQAEILGLVPKTGCRMGICNSCSCVKTSGVVKNVLTGQMSSDGEETIRPCVSVAQTDVTVKI